MIRITGFILLFLISLTLCQNEEKAKTKTEEEVKIEMKIESAAFKEGSMIPVKYTCDGDDISPPLNWSGVPEGTQSFALINDDPDAPVGLWVHWVLYNIPADTSELHENIPTDKKLKDGSKNGINSWRRYGYGGPCPPGGTHRYFFKLYALDSVLDLKHGATKVKLEKAMEGHILVQAQVMGRYKR